jgi:hypothetical protein
MKTDKSKSSSIEASTGFAFPRGLLQPQRTQVNQYADAVTQRIAQLDGIAAQLAGGFGITFTSFELNPLEVPDIADQGARLALGLMAAVARRTERVTLERREHQWGLYFTREPSMMLPSERVLTVPLREAPLDARERFLKASERFFNEYLVLCADRLGAMKGSVTAADRTLEMLSKLRLD